jgi:hypothetical protein
MHLSDRVHNLWSMDCTRSVYLLAGGDRIYNQLENEIESTTSAQKANACNGARCRRHHRGPCPSALRPDLRTSSGGAAAPWTVAELKQLRSEPPTAAEDETTEFLQLSDFPYTT